MRVAGRVVKSVVPIDLCNLLAPGPSSRAAGRSLAPLLASGKTKSNDVYVLPFLPGIKRFGSFTSSVVNARCALLERVFYHEIEGVFSAPREPTAPEVSGVLGPFTKLLSHRVNRLTPVPLAEYPASAYRGRKLKLYEKAAAVVAKRGVLRTDSFLNTFIKHEKLPMSAKRVVPRVIQPRRPEYNVSVGRYLHQLEHFLYRDIDSVFGYPTVMKGYNAFQLGSFVAKAWSQYREPACLGLDASRFDQHITHPLLLWEHGVYDLYYRSAELRRLLQWQLDNHGYVRCGDGGIKYRVRGGRCSGDMNTAMGNCLVMCATVHGLLASLGLTTRNRTKVRLFNNGDDCVLIGERSDIDLIVSAVPKWCGRVGLVMKVEPVVRSLELVSFCQCQPVYDGHLWRMVRAVDASLTKDATLLDKFHATSALSAQLEAIGCCGLALTRGLPVLQAYYTAMRRGRKAGGPVDPRFYETGFYRLSKGLVAGTSGITPEARVSFARAFGVVPDLQEALESYFNNLDLTTLGQVHDQEVSRVPL